MLKNGDKPHSSTHEMYEKFRKFYVNITTHAKQIR